MTAKKILTIGGATQDIYLHYEGADYMKIVEKEGEKGYMLFESGAKIEVEKILYFTGGGSTNSAVSFRRQGFDVSCFCQIGDDVAGKSVLDDLEKESVLTKHIITSKEHCSGTSFVINSLRRERTIFAYRGANGYLQKDQIPLKAIEDADYLYITSLSHGSAQILSDIVSHAKKHDVAVAINPGISQLAKGERALIKALKYIDIFILNLSEAKTFMGALIENDAQNVYFSLSNFFKEVMNMGPKTVVVTDGSKGVYVAQKDSMFFHPSVKVDVVDTLGAGDAFGSCFVGSIARGLSIQESLKNGIVNSAAVIGHMGAKPGLLTCEELTKKEKEIEELIQTFSL